MIERKRYLYFLLTLIVISLGLLSHSNVIPLPSSIRSYAGDTLWALMVFFGFCFIAKETQTWKIALAAITFSFMIEFSQLYQAQWINDIRHTRLGGLILGYGFLASDLICYLVGVAFGAITDIQLKKNLENFK